jgi:hydroxymethylglutaryl-CoA synthase
MLLTANPRIIAFENHWATSTKGVFDFFKPYRTFLKKKSLATTNEPWFEFRK